jgi:demethylmenaquinone methyltransferase/2-methoxy-6-polyprenyl-1,4-benzoquinol methylase
MSAHSPLAARGSPLGKPGDASSTAAAVRQMFDSVAPRYDFLNHFLSLGLDIRWRRAAALALGDILSRPGSTVADVCCGTGDLTLAFARHSAGLVVGTDFSKPMLRRALAKSRGARPQPLFLEADTLHLPFPDNALDALGAAFGFRNLASYEEGLREMRRVLKPGGRLAILEFSRLRWPLFGALFEGYFRYVLPRLGSWISGTRGPYQYLPLSVATFPDQEEFAAAFRTAGFINVQYRNFCGGVAALHLGEKG